MSAGTMRALVLREHGAGPAALELTDIPRPEPAENEVVVRVHAAGFTKTELDWPGTRRGRCGNDRARPVPGHELSGVVSDMGYGTTGLAVGQRVAGVADGTRDGSLADYVAVETRNLTPLPPDVDHITAAALPISGLTAWQALFVHADIGVGDRVLVLGAEGAVGTLGVQLAAHAGAVVVAAGRNSDGHGAMRAGATRWIDTDARADALVDAGEVDLVFDVVGGAVLDAARPLVRPGGTLVSIVAPIETPLPDGRSVFFVFEPDRPTLARLVDGVRRGDLHPRVDAVCSLADAPAAFTLPGRTIVRLVD